MFSKSKSWMGGSGGVWKPKNPHSLEHLKYLHSVLLKNQAVTEQNLSLLVETLRSISEILIWGDQNDGSVFDFFLEKNMLVFFLRFMRQKSGHIICVQLLQTLNILFDNISNETSVYYLLSNNHINSIIVHKFDFSDEEVMAYYISFLKTLSLKLNKHTIHFFYNEHTNDFALYTEAIKFFNHPESMVRIAVRTITLNVYRACRFTSQLDEFGQPIVDDRCMLRYIRDKTAAPYFSNLVYFIGDHVLTLDACVRNDIDHNSRSRLADLVAEHLDQLHYLNDILCLKIEALNEVLCCHLLERLLIPLYISSLRQQPPSDDPQTDQPRLRPSVSLFLLSQVLLILNHPSLVSRLAEIVFNDTADDTGVAGQQELAHLGVAGQRGFVKPEPLAETLDRTQHGLYADFQAKESEPSRPVQDSAPVEDPVPSEPSDAGTEEEVHDEASVSETSAALPDVMAIAPSSLSVDPHPNSTDEEKLLQHSAASVHPVFSLRDRPYLSAVLAALDCTVDDYEALFALCLLYALGHNYGIDQAVMDSVSLPTDKSETKHHYNMLLVQQLIQIMSLSCQSGSKVRLATLELTVRLLRSLVYKDGHCFLQDCHLAAVEGVREEATLQLRNFYKVWEKSEEIFLDMFEDEYREMSSRPLNVEYMTMDASILLPPTGTPLTGIDFSKRLPCGEVERARRAIRVFFLIRDLSYTLRQEQESELPLTKDEECVKVNDVLDLNNSDLIACTIVTGEKKERRFLVIDILQLILVEPDSRRLGWGVVRFVGFLQDVEVTGDRDDSRCLHVTIHKPTMNFTHGRPLPILSARFIFDDHIRCMAAKQRLTKGRLKARQRKMQMIAYLLDLPAHLIDSLYPQAAVLQSAAALRASHPGQAVPGGSLPVQNIPGRSRAVAANSESTSKQNSSNSAVERSVFASVDQVPAFNAARELEQGSRRSTSKVSGTVSSQVPAKAFRPKTAEGEVQATSEAKRSAKLLLTMAKEAKRTRQQRTKVDEAGRDLGPYPELRRIRQGVEKLGSPRRVREKISGSPEEGGATRVESVLDRACSLPEKIAQDGSAGCPRVQSLDVVRDVYVETEVGEELDQRQSAPETGGQQRTEEERKFVPQQKSVGAPKSLLPAEGTPVSLVVPCDEVPLIPPLGFMDSPVKLFPPVEPDDIHKITSAPSNSDGNLADQDEAECSEETLESK